MGAGLQAAGARGGRRGATRRRHKPVAEINVTPFVDVMLVLLIVFMVAAPLLTVGVPIDLPETRAKAMEGDVKPITVSVEAGGRIFLQEKEVKAEELVARLKALAQAGAEERILVRGDRQADYGTMMQVMGRLNEAGFRRIGLVTLEDTKG